MTNVSHRAITIILVISTIFGLISGVVGSLVARTYIIEQAFKIPFFGDINVSNGSYDGSNLVIRSAKMVVVEQNTKIKETATGIYPSLVGIFRVSEGQDKPFYNIDDEVGEAFVITSDGWLISPFLPQEFRYELEKNGEITKKTKEAIIKDHVAIGSDQTIYKIIDVIIDPIFEHSFWRIEANDLPVKEFAADADISAGATVMAMNWDKWIEVTSIAKIIRGGKSVVSSSDAYFEKLVLANTLNNELNNSFLFNLNGELVGIIDLEGNVGSINIYRACIACLLKETKTLHASLGLYYKDLSKIVENNSDIFPSKGALISPNAEGLVFDKNSPAFLAGFKEGDIIVSVNNTTIDKDNDLAKVISFLSPGESAAITFLRNGESANISVKLGEL